MNKRTITVILLLVALFFSVAIIYYLVFSKSRNKKTLIRPQIVYSMREGETDWDIYTSSANGLNQRQLTHAEADDTFPQVSPDGKKIVFTSERGGNQEIYTMNADGSGQRNLTKNKADDDAPAFSNSGKYITFSSNRSGTFQIYIMNIDGSNLRRLTHHRYNDIGPADFSPDDNMLIFKSHQPKPFGHLELSIVNFNGTDRHKLTPRNDGEEDEVWSRDGKTILFSGKRNSSWQIYTIKPDGTSLKQYTQGVAHHLRSSYSPDNKQITYTVINEGNWDLWIMDSDGRNQRKLKGDKNYKESGTYWAPDGKTILYTGVKGGKNNFNLFIMNSDGTGSKQLTFGSSSVVYPRWFNAKNIP